MLRRRSRLRRATLANSADFPWLPGVSCRKHPQGHFPNISTVFLSFLILILLLPLIMTIRLYRFLLDCIKCNTVKPLSRSLQVLMYCIFLGIFPPILATIDTNTRGSMPRSKYWSRAMIVTSVLLSFIHLAAALCHLQCGDYVFCGFDARLCATRTQQRSRRCFPCCRNTGTVGTTRLPPPLCACSPNQLREIQQIAYCGDCPHSPRGPLSPSKNSNARTKIVIRVDARAWALLACWPSRRVIDSTL